VHDREVPEATRVGFLSEVGSEELVPELDKELEGKRTGEIVKFNAVLPEKVGAEIAGTEVTFQALVKDVKDKRLPPADDEFAKTASEFDTLDELRSDIRSRLATLKEAENRAVLRDRVLSTLIDAVDVELPERLVDEETDDRVRRAELRAEQAGTTLQDALAAQGWDELRLRSDARAHAVRAIKGDLVLEAVAREEGIEATPEDVEGEIDSLAAASGRDAREVRRILERTGQVRTLAGDIIRTKALDLIIERADVASGDGPASPEPEPHEPGDETS
jgi:trigger factor